MWEEGACIYGTPGVHNNFPCEISLESVMATILIKVQDLSWHFFPISNLKNINKSNAQMKKKMEIIN